MTDLTNIFSAVDELDQDRFIKLLESLINIPTVSTPGNNYLDFVETVEPLLQELGFSLERVTVPEEKVALLPAPTEGPRINLVATKDYGKDQELCVYGHMDVVPAVEEGDEDWRTDPFKLAVKGKSLRSKRLFGRGVADMKGSIACFLLALQVMQELKLTPQFNIRLVLCTDEELGVYPGVQYLAEEGYLGDGPILCMDAGLLDRLIVGALGDLVVKIETQGVSAHSGMNFMGVNAVDCMVPIMSKLLKLKKKVESRRSRVPGIARTETPDEPFMSPMFNLNVINAGSHERHNVMPASCELTIDRRLIPEEDLDHVKAEIVEAIERGKAKMIVPAKDVEISYQYNYPPAEFDQLAPIFKRIKKVIEAVHGIPQDNIPLWSVPGSTDMGSVIQVLDRRNIIMRGVANPASAPHGVNESIKLKDAYQFIKELIVLMIADFEVRGKV